MVYIQAYNKISITMGMEVGVNSMTSELGGVDVDVSVSGFPDDFMHTKETTYK